MTILTGNFTGTENMSIIMWTALVTPVIWVFYKTVTFILDIKRRGDRIKKFPCPDPFHWLLGNLIFVSIRYC